MSPARRLSVSTVSPPTPNSLRLGTSSSASASRTSDRRRAFFRRDAPRDDRSRLVTACPQVTASNGMPSNASQACRARVRPIDNNDLGPLRVIFSTGSPLSPEDYEYVYTKVTPATCGSMRFHAVTSTSTPRSRPLPVVTCGYLRLQVRLHQGHARYLRLHAVACGYEYVYTKVTPATCGYMRLPAVTSTSTPR